MLTRSADAPSTGTKGASPPDGLQRIINPSGVDKGAVKSNNKACKMNFVVGIVLVGLFQLATCQKAPVPPYLPSDFKVNVVYNSWFDQDIYQFTIAYTRQGQGLGNRLYVSRLSQGVRYTKLYDFSNDVLYEAKGENRQCVVTKGIPESEKTDPYFPVHFKKSASGKVFDDPSSLVRFKSKDMKWKDSAARVADEWVCDGQEVTFKGQTYQCSTSMVWSKMHTISPYCDEKLANKGFCPRVPLDSLVTCGDDKAIRYTFSDYREDFDYSIFEEPMGFFCEGMERATLPQLPNVMSFAAETKTSDSQDVVRSRVWYDLPSFLVVRDTYHVVGAETLTSKYVLDYSTGMKYYITTNTGKCQAFVMHKDELTIPSPSAIVWGAGRDYAFQKAGERPCRSWNCAVYAGMDDNPGGPQKSKVANLYYAYLDETETASLPVSMEVYDEAKGGDVVEHRQIFDVESNFKDWWPFDISSCFHSHEITFIMLTLRGNSDFGIGTGTQDGLAQAVRIELTKAMGIAQDIRLNRVMVNPAGENQVKIFARLLPEARTDHTIVADPTVDEALKRLNETVAAGNFKVVLNVTGASENPVYVGTALQTRLFNNEQPVAAASYQGYSSGSMAALGIMMLLIGAALAVGAVFLVARRFPHGGMTTMLLQPRKAGTEGDD